MGLTQGDEDLAQRYKTLCADLNMDQSTEEEAWDDYEKIKQNYSLDVSFSVFILQGGHDITETK